MMVALKGFSLVEMLVLFAVAAKVECLAYDAVDLSVECWVVE